jgi:hypothetical protein
LGFTNITARGFDIAWAQIQRAQMLARNLTKLPGVDLTFEVADLTGDLPEADADLTLCLYSFLSHLPVARLPKPQKSRALPQGTSYLRCARWAALLLFP